MTPKTGKDRLNMLTKDDKVEISEFTVWDIHACALLKHSQLSIIHRGSLVVGQLLYWWFYSAIPLGLYVLWVFSHLYVSDVSPFLWYFYILCLNAYFSSNVCRIQVNTDSHYRPLVGKARKSVTHRDLLPSKLIPTKSLTCIANKSGFRPKKYHKEPFEFETILRGVTQWRVFCSKLLCINEY